ncbi:MAG: Ig-like domain-containing protein, partial [Candidatus Poribacteria bacterium]|nr:Ig-like domain-containing protein [Candidatus Poribacteria bacterium]
NGLAYVADHDNGVHVINYLAFDAQGQPPTIELSASFDLDAEPVQAEEGKAVRITAAVTDDVQVRNVEFYVDGVKVATDGNFPFEHRFTTPSLAQRERFTLRARASDTGGNATWTDELAVVLVPDATPPRVLSFSPRDNAVLGKTRVVAAFFSEPIDASSLRPDTFFLREIGPDGEFNTEDDGVVNTGVLEFRDDVRGAFMTFADGAPPGNYLVEVTTAVTDLAGNGLTETATSGFQIFDIADDRDGDGVPDGLEVALGLDPDNPDSDGDGTLDGAEDFDDDGLSNLGEVLLETDATNPDTDGDGIPDGEEDMDGDGLTDGREILARTDPRNPDTDGDGFNDAVEVDNQSNPLNPKDTPIRTVVVSLSVFNRADPTFAVRNAIGPVVSVQNRANPTFAVGNAIGPVVSVRNRANPIFTVGNAIGQVVSVFNTTNPILFLGYARGAPVSVFNAAPPAAIAGKVQGRVVSVENVAEPPQEMRALNPDEE